MIRCGGTTDAKVADKEAQDLLDAVSRIVSYHNYPVGLCIIVDAAVVKL